MFVFTGTLLWSILIDSLNAPLGQVNGNRALLAKINVPREALVLTGTALGLAITPVGVLYGDIGRGIPLITQFSMYLSPVVFPLAATGWTAQLMRLNPLTPLILNARAWFTAQPPQLLGEWALAVFGSAVLLLLVWMVSRLAMPILIERMSA
ncbi:MAG: ABC transporter permease [Cyanobium sp.]